MNSKAIGELLYGTVIECKDKTDAFSGGVLPKQKPGDAGGAQPGTQIHVRLIGSEGWDGTPEGKGEFENEPALRQLFSPFGTFMQVCYALQITASLFVLTLQLM